MIDKVSPPEIVDPHMHVGDFPLFDVGMDADGLVQLFADWNYAAGIVFAFVLPGVSYAMYLAVALMWLIPDRRVLVPE